MHLTDSNIVLLGGFNPNIIQPLWLSRYDVVREKGEEFKTEIQFGPATPQVMTFQLDGFRWEVSLDRVLIGSGEARSPAEWLIRLLDLLPHTPIRAVGVNFRLRSERSDWPLEVPKLPNQESAASLIGEIAASTAVTRGRLEDHTQVNLTLNATSDEVVLDANLHRGVKHSKEVSAMDMAKQAMSEFDSDWQRVRLIVSAITGTEVSR